MIPGEIAIRNQDMLLNMNRERFELTVTNMSDRPIQVGSHYHFFEVNAALEFNRELTKGYRLDIPAGTQATFEPEETLTVQLVELGGDKRAYGFRGDVMGKAIRPLSK